MKKVLTLGLMIALTMTVMAQKPRVAVYVSGDDPINELVGSSLEDGLAHNGKYTAVERTASFLSALSKEHEFQRSGEVDDDQIAELGKQFSVQYVCVASVSTVWGNEKYISARIIDVESAEVMASGCSNGATNTTDQLVRALDGLSESLLTALDYSKVTGAKKVAIYVTKSGNRDVDIILGDQLVAGFAKSGKYLAIERTSRFLSELSKEQGYQQSGAVSDEDLVRLGQKAGVQYVCVAKTSKFNDDYFISSRLIDVVHGDILNSSYEKGKKLNNSQNVISVAADIATKLSGRTIEEEEAYQKAEAIRKEQEEQKRKKEEQERIIKEKEEKDKQRQKDIEYLKTLPVDGPRWTRKPPNPRNKTYFYVIQHSSGESIQEAQNYAMLEIFRMQAMRLGIPIDWTEVVRDVENGKSDWGEVAEKYVIAVNKVCEYVFMVGSGRFVVYVLCQVAVSAAVFPEFTPFDGCNK